MFGLLCILLLVAAQEPLQSLRDSSPEVELSYAIFRAAKAFSKIALRGRDRFWKKIIFRPPQNSLLRRTPRPAPQGAKPGVF
jgi:hypothetical protein